VTVIGIAQIRQRLWRGYDDPGLPVGTYVGWVQVTGDASGGDNNGIITYEPEGQPLTGRFYNLERCEFQTTQAANLVVAVNLANFTPPVAGALMNRLLGLTVEFNDRSDGASNINGLPRPVFLGQAQLSNSPAQILFTSDNSDGDVIIAYVEGYIWEARSVQALGGLRRPLDSLYG